MTRLKRYRVRLGWFLGLVWRESPAGGRITPRAAWSVAMTFTAPLSRLKADSG